MYSIYLSYLMCSMCLYFNLFTLSLNILFLMFYEVFIYAIGVERVRVVHIANLCVTRWEGCISYELVRYVDTELSNIF
jgi:hypothetical protein